MPGNIVENQFYLWEFNSDIIIEHAQNIAKIVDFYYWLATNINYLHLKVFNKTLLSFISN